MGVKNKSMRYREMIVRFAGMVLLLALVLITVLCRQAGPESESGGISAGERENVKEETEKENSMYEENARILMEGLGLKSRTGTLGTARTLDECGFGQISRIRKIEAFRSAWRAELEDQEGKIYTITVDADGYLGTIRDEKGEYLYAPVD